MPVSDEQALLASSASSPEDREVVSMERPPRLTEVGAAPIKEAIA
jgi:hypothetical protein